MQTWFKNAEWAGLRSSLVMVRNLKVGRTWIYVGIVEKGKKSDSCSAVSMYYITLILDNIRALGVSRLCMRVSSSTMTGSRNGPDLPN